jgi:hypothetical protein
MRLFQLLIEHGLSYMPFISRLIPFLNLTFAGICSTLGKLISPPKPANNISASICGKNCVREGSLGDDGMLLPVVAWELDPIRERVLSMQSTHPTDILMLVL